MLVNRLMKKVPNLDESQKRLVDSEVAMFINHEYLTRETMKQLENKIVRQLTRHASAYNS